MIIHIGTANADEKLRQIAEERMQELQERANYLTRVFCRPFTVEDVIEMEKDEEN